ncbi:MAG: HK97 gp10 family phage protein, partial [Clostridia bacterium]|nr:HK97 gp10 family phage protein [Clostridia bacterium]
MAIKWTNPNILTVIRQRAEDEYDRKAVEFLSKVGEMACAKARQLGTYTNRTGHLRNSISYIVLQNGAIKVDAFGHTVPMKESQKYAREMAK